MIFNECGNDSICYMLYFVILDFICLFGKVSFRKLGFFCLYLFMVVVGEVGCIYGIEIWWLV